MSGTGLLWVDLSWPAVRPIGWFCDDHQGQPVQSHTRVMSVSVGGRDRVSETDLSCSRLYLWVWGFFMNLSVPSFESWWPSIGTSSILTSPLQHRKLSWLQMYCQPDSSATRFISSLTSAPLAAADKSSTWGVILLNETWTVLETL